MANHRILALFALSILSRPLLAAAPVLGPEVPLVPGLEMRTAAYDQDLPTAASNGDDFVVAWADGRRLGSDIFVTRVGNDGHPVEPLGRRVVAGTRPKIASAGGDYVLVWQFASSLNSIRLSAGAMQASAPHLLGSGEVVALVSNGSSYLLVTRPEAGALTNRATILDRDGVPLRTVAKTFATTIGAAAFGGQYYLVDTAASSLILHTIAQDGSVTDQALPAADPAPKIAAFAPGAILIAWDSLIYRVAGYDGRTIKAPTALTVPDPQTHVAAGAGWDGREFSIVYSPLSSLTGNVRLYRITLDGTVPAPPLSLAPTTVASGAAYASSTSGQLVVWSESHNFTHEIVGVAAPSFSALAAAAPTAAEILSYSGEAQGDVQIARGPRGVLAVWDDADRWLQASASFNGGPPITLQATPGPDYIGWPAVMAGKNVYLVVWRHAVLGSPGSDRLLAKRFDFDGHDLDPQPLVLSSEVLRTQAVSADAHAPSLAFDGSSFLVAWAESADLYAIRIGETGPPLGEEEAEVGTISLRAHSARALWSGTEYLVGYTVDDICLINLCTTPRHFSMTRVARAGTIASAVAPPAIFYFGQGDTHVGTTWANGAMTVVWARAGVVFLGQTAPDGKVLLSPRTVARAATETPNPEIIWNGSEYVLVWLERIGDSQGHRVMAIRLDIDLRPIDNEPFIVSLGPAPRLPPSLTVTPSGVLIAYSRADDANGDAPRLFMRALDRIPTSPHRRAVRR